MNATDYSTIEGAYLAGFEPSADDLTGAALLKEAEQYLYSLILN